MCWHIPNKSGGILPNIWISKWKYSKLIICARVFLSTSYWWYMNIARCKINTGRGFPLAKFWCYCEYIYRKYYSTEWRLNPVYIMFKCYLSDKKILFKISFVNTIRAIIDENNNNYTVISLKSNNPKLCLTSKLDY